MWDWLCSPNICSMAGWLYDFQNLAAGVAAVIAAGVAAFVPELFRRRSDRQSQAQRGTQVSIDLVMHSSHIRAE